MFDQKAREHCIDFRRSFVVKASAGCGKTHESVNRILSLLANAVDQPEEILAITFTVDAAEELRARVLGALRRASTGTSWEAHETTTRELASKALCQDAGHNWEILLRPDRLKIMTFDSFFQMLNTQVGTDESGGEQLKISQSPEVLYDRAIDALLADAWKQEMPWHEAVVALWQIYDGREASLRNTLLNMLKARDQWFGILGASLQDNEMPGIQKIVKRECISSINPVALDEARSLIHNLEGHECWTNEALSAYARTEGEPDVEACVALSNWLLTKDGSVKKRVTTADGFPKQDKHNKAEVAELKGAFAQLRAMLCDERSVQALRLMRLLGEDEDVMLETMSTVLQGLLVELKIVMAQSGECDFTEVAMRAIDILGQENAPSEMLLKLDYQIKHLLIDEAQDTSNTQLKALELVTSGWQTGDGRTMFVVGDPKQSIYKFRKANAGIFEDLAANGLGQVKLTCLELNSNFRSCAPIVGWVDNLFESSFPSNSLRFMNGFAHSRSHSIKTSENSKVAVTIVDGKDKMDARRNEAEFLCSEIQKIKEADPEATIAMIGRSRNAFSAVIDTMAKYGIDHSGIDIQALGESPDAGWVAALCGVLLNPESKEDWISLVHSPLVGVSLETLTQWLSESGSDISIEHLMRTKTMSLPEGEQKSRLAKVIWAVDNKKHIPVGELTERVWQSLDGLAIAKANCAQSKSDKVFKMINELASEQRLCRYNLRQKINESYGTKDAISSHAVQCMTIHRSKGLEFDHVFVIGAGDAGRHDDLPMVRMDTIQWEHHWGVCLASKQTKGEQLAQYKLLGEIEKQRSIYETQRLLYVAVTRAKEGLQVVLRSIDEAIEWGAGSLLSACPEIIEGEILRVATKESESIEDRTSGEIYVKSIKRQGSMQDNSVECRNHVKIQDIEFSGNIIERRIGDAGHRLMELWEQSNGNQTIDWNHVATKVIEEYGLAGNEKARTRLYKVAGQLKTDAFTLNRLINNSEWTSSEHSFVDRKGTHDKQIRVDLLIKEPGQSGVYLIDYKFPEEKMTREEADSLYGKTLEKYEKVLSANGVIVSKRLIVQPEFDEILEC